MNHNVQPFTSRWGNCNIDPAALGSPTSVIRQPLSVWEEHRVHIDLFRVGEPRARRWRSVKAIEEVQEWQTADV